MSTILSMLLRNNDPFAHAFVTYCSKKYDISHKVLLSVLNDKTRSDVLRNPHRAGETKYLVRMGLLRRAGRGYQRTVLGERILVLLDQIESFLVKSVDMDEKQLVQIAKNHVDNDNLDRLLYILLAIRAKHMIKKLVDNKIEHIKKTINKTRWDRDSAESVFSMILDLSHHSKHLSEEQLEFLTSWALYSLRLLRDTQKLKALIDEFPALAERVMSKMLSKDS